MAGEPYPILDGRICNVPAGLGGKPTTINMRRKQGQIVETVSEFQSRVRRLVADARKPSCSTPLTRGTNESGLRETRERRSRCSGDSGSSVSSRPYSRQQRVNPYSRPSPRAKPSASRVGAASIGDVLAEAIQKANQQPSKRRGGKGKHAATAPSAHLPVPPPVGRPRSNASMNTAGSPMSATSAEPPAGGPSVQLPASIHADSSDEEGAHRPPSPDERPPPPPALPPAPPLPPPAMGLSPPLPRPAVVTSC